MPRMKRKDALAAIRAAGYHGDQERGILLYVRNRVSLQVYNREFDTGAAMRRNGVPCDCLECRKSGACGLTVLGLGLDKEQRLIGQPHPLGGSSTAPSRARSNPAAAMAFSARLNSKRGSSLGRPSRSAGLGTNPNGHTLSENAAGCAGNCIFPAQSASRSLQSDALLKDQILR
jgi:hypothetical protein